MLKDNLLKCHIFCISSFQPTSSMYITYIITSFALHMLLLIYNYKLGCWTCFQKLRYRIHFWNWALQTWRCYLAVQAKMRFFAEMDTVLKRIYGVIIAMIVGTKATNKHVVSVSHELIKTVSTIFSNRTLASLRRGKVITICWFQMLN